MKIFYLIHIIEFRPVPANIYSDDVITENELVIRIQPNEALYINIMNKVPSLRTIICSSQLAQKYEQQYQNLPIPDAYERLLLNIIKGQKSNFVWEEEVSESWRIFDKVLDDETIPIETYEFGSFGPGGADVLAAKYGVKWSSTPYCYEVEEPIFSEKK